MTNSVIQKSQLEGADRLDAEYYQSEYLEYKGQLLKLETKPLHALTDKIDVGFVSSMTGHFQKSGIPLLRTQNVKPFYPDLESDIVYVDEEFHKKLKKSQVFPGQILLARSGSIGDACIVPDNFPMSNSADIILITPSSKVQPEYLTAFINSRYGQFQIDRASSGGLQGHMNLFSLEKLLVPLPNDNLQKQVAQTVRSGLIELKNSQKYYSRAENLLLEELGLKDFQTEVDMSFIVNLADVQSAHRADAEFFQPKYQRLIEQISLHNGIKLGNLVTMQKGVEPGSEAYQEKGKLFIRVSSLSKNGIEEKDQKYLSEDLYQKLKNDYEPKVGEILLTKDATLGVAYVLKKPIEGIISSGILRLKTKADIDAEYLTLCINSILGKMQAERDAGGSILVHWKPEQIRNVTVPVLPKSTQDKIADCIRRSHAAYQKSKTLLEQAKRAVEEMIELTP